jgi:methylmalonyl-CoA mutase
MKVGDLLKSASFPEFGMERWRALAEKALGGAPFEETLVSRTDDDIRIEPLALRVRDAMPRGARKDPAASWSAVQRIDDPDPARANRQVLEDLEQGANGLALIFEGAPNAFGYGLPARPEAIAIALHNVPLNHLGLRLDVHPASRASIDWLFAYLIKRRVDPARLGLSFGIDPAAVFAGTGRLKMSIEALRASMPQSLAHFFALGLPGILLEGDGRVFHNAGATEAQELGVAIASAVWYLRMFEEARQPLVYAAPHIGFSLAVDQDQFASIAKLRALRTLWARVAEVCSIPPAGVSLHAETSYRMMTRMDPETNILRNTVAAFAAIVGGADSVSVLPHTIALGLPDAFARRVARNTQTILASESHVGFVADPTAGSGAVESLTDALCEAAWDEFRTIEREGGVLNSLHEGRLQSRIVEARDRRAAAYRAGTRKIVGTTLHPLAAEKQFATLAAATRTVQQEAAVSCEPLQAVRIDETIGTLQ